MLRRRRPGSTQQCPRVRNVGNRSISTSLSLRDVQTIGSKGDLGDPVPRQVMVVGAHPDDIDFGVAGTVARLVLVGADVVYCIVVLCQGVNWRGQRLADAVVDALVPR